jgi:hypothetical protein
MRIIENQSECISIKVTTTTAAATTTTTTTMRII